MSMAMYGMAIVLSCLTCSHHARRVQSSTEQGGHNSAEAFGKLLLALTTPAAFNPSSLGVRVPLARRPIHHGRYTPVATMEEAAVAEKTVETSSLKEELLSVIGIESLASMPSESMQMDLNEKILALSASNPTSEPASSPMLDGKWEVIYSGSPAIGITDSPTRQIALALYATPLVPSVLAQLLAKLPFNLASLGDLTVTISPAEMGQPRVTAETSITVLSGDSQPVVVRSNLQPQSGVALSEEFIDVEAFGQRNDLPGPLALSRSLYVTYLDEDLLIMRDDTGLPSVLRRADKYVSSYETTAADFTDDDDDGVPAAD